MTARATTPPTTPPIIVPIEIFRVVGPGDDTGCEVGLGVAELVDEDTTEDEEVGDGADEDETTLPARTIGVAVAIAPTPVSTAVASGCTFKMSLVCHDKASVTVPLLQREGPGLLWRQP